MDKKSTINTRGRYQLQYRGTECQNCGHPLDMSDKFCPNCSQANSTKKLTIKDFFDEFFSSLVSYDSRLLKTLGALLLRPGKITTDYVNGKRVSYTNPFRFLLSLAIIYFLMLNFTGNFTEFDRFGASEKDSPLALDVPLNFSLYVNEEEQKDALKALDSLGIRDSINKFAVNRDSVIMANPKNHFNSIKGDAFWDRFFEKAEFFHTILRKDTIYSFDEVENKYGIKNSMENKTAFSTAASFIKVSRQPGSFFSSMVSKLPFATFFFLPVFALFIWLVYIRKKYNYTDNLIFSFHNQSLLFILLIVSFLVDSVFSVDSNWLFITIFATYLYAAMRNFYRQGHFKTIIKYLFLNTIFFILATLTAVLLVIGSAVTY